MLNLKRSMAILLAGIVALPTPTFAGKIDAAEPGRPPQRVTRMGAKAVACWQMARAFLLAEGAIDEKFAPPAARANVKSTLKCMEKHHIGDRDFPGIVMPGSWAKVSTPRLNERAVEPQEYEKICQMPWNNDLVLVSCNTPGSTPLP
jgi:hypothetical protein